MILKLYFREENTLDKSRLNNNFSAIVPYDMELQRKETKEMLDDLTTRDQRMMFGILTMVHNTSLSGAATIGYNDMITEVVSMPIAVIAAGILQLIVYIVATYLHLQRLAQRSPLELVRKG